MSLFVGYTNSYDLLSGQVDSVNLRVHPDTAEVAYLGNNANIKTESAPHRDEPQLPVHRPILEQNDACLWGGQVIDQPFAAGVNKTNKFKFGGRTVFAYANEASPLRPTVSVGGGVSEEF